MMYVKSLRFQHEYDEPNRVSPEEKLWRAVIFSAVEDIESALRSASNHMVHFGGASAGYCWEIRKIDKQVASDWFKEICSAVDVDQKHIVKLIDRCKAKYNFGQMKFVDRTVAVEMFKEKHKDNKKRSYKASGIK